MTTDTSIGLGEPRPNKSPDPQSGIEDEAGDGERRRRDARDQGGPGTGDDGECDLTREDIASGNDRNASADQGNRSGKTSHGDGSDAIELGR